jgi:hypothetical protein
MQGLVAATEAQAQVGLGVEGLEEGAGSGAETAVGDGVAELDEGVLGTIGGEEAVEHAVQGRRAVRRSTDRARSPL